MVRDGMYTVLQPSDFIEYFLGARLPVQKYAFIVSKLIATWQNWSMREGKSINFHRIPKKTQAAG